MKRALLAVALLLLSTSASAQNSVWLHGVVSNPGAGAVIVDTGPFSIDGNRTPCAWMAATAASVARFQWIDTDGTTIIHEQYMPVGVNGYQNFCIPNTPQPMLTLQNQRFRIIVASTVIGNVSGSIFVTEGI